MIVNGERALAYIVTIDEIKPIEGYDRVEYARTSGWWVIVSKNDGFKVGDKAVYFEIDSLVNKEDERFNFLAKRNYRIKSMKMCKVLSQGLLMPIGMFNELRGAAVGTNVTKALGVTYYNAEDRARKSLTGDPNAKYKAMAQRHPNIFKKNWARWLMRREWGRKLMFVVFGKKKDKPTGWPTKFEYVKRTDEDRIENLPQYWGFKEPLVVTEKLDGTSTTFILERKPFNRYEFYVLSRNVRQRTPDQKCYHEDNVYWEMAEKYKVREVLEDILCKNPGLKYVAIQGETVGKDLQGNPLKMEHRDFYAFNFIDSRDGRWGTIEGARFLEKYGIHWVPFIRMEFEFPDTIEEIKRMATGPSLVNPNVMREGLVIRTMDGKISFKNVSNEYLLAKGE